MNLFDLPPHYMVSVLQDWVSVAEIVILNSACCEEKQRQKLTHLLSVFGEKDAVRGSYQCEQMMRLIFKSGLRSSNVIKDVIFTWKVPPKLQCDIFQQYDKEGRLQDIRCIEKRTSVSQLMLSVVKRCFRNSLEFFMWYDNSSSSSKTFSGHCIFRENKRGYYVGNMVNGRGSGYGRYSFINGEWYEGDWKDGFMHGHGTFKWPDGSIYEGEYKVNKLCGYGVSRHANGSIYMGMWEDGKRNGYGVSKWSDGTVYEGEFRDDKTHGHGVFRYSTGDVYDGQFVNGAKESGKFQFANGDMFEGEIKDEKLTVQVINGVMEYVNGDVFEGQFKDNKRHGRGVMKYANGDVYQGHWVHGERHGLGKQLNRSGVVRFEGLWMNDDQRCRLRLPRIFRL